jgi:hypothetical protein
MSLLNKLYQLMEIKEDEKIEKHKTKYLVASRRNSNSVQEQYTKIEERIFKRVVQFKYLGSIISKDNDVKIEVSSRIQQANEGYYGLE